MTTLIVYQINRLGVEIYIYIFYKILFFKMEFFYASDSVVLKKKKKEEYFKRFK